MKRVALAALLLAVVGVAGCGGDAERVGQPPQSAPAGSTKMDEARFWGLVDEIHARTGLDMEKKEALLTERLAGLAVEDLRAYSRLWDAAMDRAYDWRLWAAAYVIQGGCSDDAFSDFRSTIIMLGRTAYEAAIQDPDTLVEVARVTRGELFHENFGYPVNAVWKEKTGKDFVERASPTPLKPTGEAWEEDDLPRIVPGLWRQFGEGN